MTDNLTHRPASEIQEAINMMDHPNFCPGCGEFYDTYSRECPECLCEDMLGAEHTPYFLECAVADEFIAGKE